MLAVSAMSQHLYNTVLFVHILMATIWVGGAITLQVYAALAMRAGPQQTADFAKNAEFIGQRVFMPASVILLLLGLWMVFGWDYWGLTDVWVLVGLAGVAFSIIVGTGFVGPESGRIGRLVAEKGMDDPEVTTRVTKILRISRIELVVLVVVIWDMAYKPFA